MIGEAAAGERANHDAAEDKRRREGEEGAEGEEREERMQKGANERSLRGPELTIDDLVLLLLLCRGVNKENCKSLYPAI